MTKLFSGKLNSNQVEELSAIIQEPGFNTYYGMNNDQPVAIINAPTDYNPKGLVKLSEKELINKKFEVHYYGEINPKHQELIKELDHISNIFPLFIDSLHVTRVRAINSFEQTKQITSSIFRKIIQDEINGNIVIYSVPEAAIESIEQGPVFTYKPKPE